jgi:hypothetical protein
MVARRAGGSAAFSAQRGLIRTPPARNWLYHRRRRCCDQYWAARWILPARTLSRARHVAAFRRSEENLIESTLWCLDRKRLWGEHQ